jgi:hypothetical protein
MEVVLRRSNFWWHPVAHFLCNPSRIRSPIGTCEMMVYSAKASLAPESFLRR